MTPSGHHQTNSTKIGPTLMAGCGRGWRSRLSSRGACCAGPAGATSNVTVDPAGPLSRVVVSSRVSVSQGVPSEGHQQHSSTATAQGTTAQGGRQSGRGCWYGTVLTAACSSHPCEVCSMLGEVPHMAAAAHTWPSVCAGQAGTSEHICLRLHQEAPTV
jgi:hypothetical protein